MPLITPPTLVGHHLATHGFDQNPNLLIIAENYPKKFGVRPWGYFYRTLYPHPLVGAKSFFDSICHNFGIPKGTESKMLNDFLNGVGIGNGSRLLIDALPDGVPAVHPITTTRLNELVIDINYINPKHILVLANRNVDTIKKLLLEPAFTAFIPRLVSNPLATGNGYIFPYPAAPANHKRFTACITAARVAGFPI